MTENPLPPDHLSAKKSETAKAEFDCPAKKVCLHFSSIIAAPSNEP
jgi:hypothetical protein